MYMERQLALTVSRADPHRLMVNLSEAERSRVENSSLIINGKLDKLRDFESKGAKFARLLTDEGQVYFDQTRYISVLDIFKKPILVFRPRRFGKSLTVN